MGNDILGNVILENDIIEKHQKTKAGAIGLPFAMQVTSGDLHCLPFRILD